MTLTVSSDLKIYKSFQKATRFSKDRDFVIHARLCRLCPAPWTLLQIHPERKVDIKHSSLFSTSHLGDSGLTPFKLALVILGHQFSQITAQVLWMSSLSAKSTSPHPCQHSEVLVAVSHGCWLCDRVGVLWEMCHPSYRGQLLHSHHPHAGSFARQHVHGIRLRGCFSLASRGAVWEPAHSHHPVLWQHARERRSLRSHRWAALSCAALTPLVQANTFYSLWHKARTPR